mgnify:CR=1 FL=1
MAREYTSAYTVEDFVINDIMPKYFKVSDTSLYQVGLLGMLTDISAFSIADQYEVVGRYLNEALLSRASLPDFIYAFAASYGVTNLFATPAKMPMFLYVKEKDILEQSKVVGNHREFTLDSDMKIYVDGEDDLVYSIPYDITIRSMYYKGEYSHTAIFDENYTNSVASLSTPYIKLIRTTVSGDKWLALRIDVYQYDRKKREEQITTNNKLNIPYIEVDYEDQICNFEVFYTSPDGKRVQLAKKMETLPAVTTPFIYYKMLDDNTIRLSFANDDRYWVPEYNSTLSIWMYETKGKDGNFGWNVEEVSARPVPQTENEDLAYNRNLFLEGQIIGESRDGDDQMTLEEVKRTALERMVTIDSYTTDTDLNIHFLNYGKNNNTNTVVVKHRDDVAGRSYGCFTRFGDGTDIYPTNTLDMRIKTSEVSNRFDNLRQFIINPGTSFVYDGDDLSTLRIKGKDEVVDPSAHQYSSLGLMVISLKANTIRQYLTSIDKGVVVEYSYMNDESVFNFLLGNCRINRDSINGDMEYTITTTIGRVDGITEVTTGDVTTPIEMDPSKLKVLIIFNTSVGHYVEMTLTSEDDENLLYSFETKIETNDMITDGRISLTNLLTQSDGTKDSRVIDMMNPDITLAVFYDYGDGGDNHIYNHIEVVKTYTLCNTYTPEQDEFYFAYPLNLMRSSVIFEDDPDSNDGYSFLLKQVPVIGMEFLKDPDNLKAMFTALVDQHRYMTDLVKQITQNFTINMKFYNTYGRSKLFYLSDEETLLNRVNSDIHIGIAFYDGVIPEDYIPQIQIDVKNYIETVNALNEGLNKIHVSLMIQLLHNKYPDQINYLEFYSINGYDSSIQSVQTLVDIDSTTEPSVVPEYLTLKSTDVKITIL